MILSDIFIRRPVFAIIVNAIILVLGLYALSKLAVRELPSFDVPIVTVTTALPGASAELIETEVSSRIEQSVAAIDGIDYMSSTSSSGQSAVQITFKSEGATRTPVADVRAKLDLVRAQLPTDVKTPVVQQLSTNAIPIMYLSLSSATRSALELTEIYETIIRTPLSGLRGVAAINLIGERKYAVRVQLDPIKLVAFDVTPEEVRAAMVRGNIDAPAGSISEGGIEIDVIAETALASAREFADIVLKSKDDYIVRVKDVAHVSVAASNVKSGVLIDGKQGLAIGVIRQPVANALTVAALVKQEMRTLQASLPSDVELAVSFDSTIFIAESVEEVFLTLRDAVILVIVVILIFLGSIRASLVTLATIPLSLIGTLAFMLLMDYSLNTFSLLAIVLSVGLVVDDAIVDVENVQRHIARGLSPLTAAFVGSREIGFAVIATTLTLASVYLPIGFLPGLMGKLFQEFAFTLAAAVLLSGFISRTLSPMMCSRLLRPARSGRLGLGRRVSRALGGFYRWTLELAMGTRWAVYGLLIAVGIIAGSAASVLPGKLAPSEDQGYLIARFSGPPSGTYEALAAKAQELSDVLDAVPEKQRSLILLGTPDQRSGLAVLVLKPLAERSRSAQEIQREIAPKLAALPGLTVDVVDAGILSGGGQLPVQMVVKTTGDYTQLKAAMDAVLAKARAMPELVAPISSLRFNSPRLQVGIDREAAGNLGIDATAIANAVATSIGQLTVTSFAYGTRSYDVIMELEDTVDGAEAALGLIQVRDAAGTAIPLRRLVSTARSVGADTLEHFDGQRSATLSASLAPGASLANVLIDLEATAREALPAGTAIDWTGASRQIKQASASSGLVFLLSFVFIYGFLAAQFESFRDPFIVLLVVPFSVFGGLLALQILGGSLNLYSGIGLVTLVGLVAKQGILVTEFANQLREEGRTIREAAMEAATTRLRPIMMTSIAMIAGAMPLIYNSGSGANGRFQIGLVIIGGMIVGTLLALYVVPVTYSLFSKRHRPPLAVPPSDEEARRLLHGQFARTDTAPTNSAVPNSTDADAIPETSANADAGTTSQATEPGRP